jgi:hypothetical protein
MLKGFFESKDNRNKSTANRGHTHAKTEMSHYESMESGRPQRASSRLLKASTSVHPNYVVAKYKKMKQTGKLDKLERDI